MSGVLNLLLAGAASAIKDAYFNLTTLLLNTSSTNGAQNNTFLDSSSNTFTITRNGNTTQGTFTPFSQTGWSNFFGGSTDYVAFTSIAAYGVGTGNFSVQTFVNFNSISGNQRIFCVGASGTDGINVQFAGSTTQLQIDIANTRIITYTWTPVVGTWYQIDVVRAGTGTNQTTLYINGSSVATGTSSGSVGQNAANIGGISWNSSFTVNGYVSNVRFSNTARSISAVTTNYSSDANTLLLTAQSNRFVDNSSTGNTFTIGGTPSVQAFSPFAPTAAYDSAVVGGSGYFDGTSDYLVFGSGQANANFNGNCSIELWFYPTGAAAAGLLTAKYGGTTNQFYVNSQSNNLIYCEFLGSTFYAKTSSGSFTRNAWNHLLITKSSTTAKMWLNGVYEGSWTVSTSNSSTDAIGVGATQGGATTFNGYISGIRYSNTATETGTSNITLPTAPLTSNGNTAALLSFTNAGIYDAAAKNDLETVGGAQVSTTQAKFGTTSMYFDGTGDNLQLASTPTFAMGSGNWTVEMWLYPNSIASLQALLSFGGGSWRLFLNNAGLWFLNGGSGIINVATAVTTGQWYHIALVKAGTGTNQTSLYLNGVLIGSGTDANTYAPGIAFVGSEGAGSYLNGYIDDLRVTKYARYTTTFTPPTASFPTQ